MNDIHKKIVPKITQLLNENLKLNRIYLSFPQYVSLVQRTIDLFLNDPQWNKTSYKPAIFTALCVTPFQWFNFIIRPKRTVKTTHITKLDQIESMHADKHWIDYHKYLIRRKCAKIIFHDNGSIECKLNEDIKNCIKGIAHINKLVAKNDHKYCSEKIVEQVKFEFHRYLFTVDFATLEVDPIDWTVLGLI